MQPGPLLKHRVVEQDIGTHRQGRQRGRYNIQAANSPTSTVSSADQQLLQQAAKSQALALITLQLAGFSVVCLHPPSPGQAWQTVQDRLQAPLQREWVLPGAHRRIVRGRRKLLGLLPGQQYHIIEPGPWWTPSGVANCCQQLPAFKWTFLAILALAACSPYMHRWRQARQERDASMEATLAENAGSLAIQRTRLQQALGSTALGSSEAVADTAQSADVVSSPEDSQVRDAAVLAQWAKFMQSSKAMQMRQDQWWDADSVEEHWPPRGS